MLIIYLLLPALSFAEPTPHWWDTYTTVVSHPQSIKDLAAVGAGAIRSAGYFGGWYGFWFLDSQEARPNAARTWKRVQEAGARKLVYYDAGEVGDYVIFFDAAGKLRYNGWSLPFWKPQDLTARWFGLAAFMRDPPWAPFPSASSYRLPPFTSPEGKPDPALYPLLAARDIDGQWKYSYYSNPRITDEMARRSGLARLSARQAAAAEVKGKSGWKTVRLVSVDYANPQLGDYVCREIARLIEKTRPDGVHIDNFGDLNILYPRRRAFGVWSIHSFREYMTKHFTRPQLRALGIDDIRAFSIQDYIQKKPYKSRGHAWQYLNRRWAEDAIWMCYVLSKVEAGLGYHRELYRAAKEAGRRAKTDLLVFGNTVPMAPGRTFLKGTCDIAHFEWKTVGRFGPIPEMGLPPRARVGYVTRLGAAISAAPYCWPGIYVPKKFSGKGHENLHKVLAFDCLANRGLLDYNYWYLDGYSPGTDRSAGVINRFIREHARALSHREFIPDIGLVYSDWSNIASITVAYLMADGFLEDYMGWADFLCRTHRQWDVILAPEMTARNLSRFPILILPSVAVLSDRQVKELQKYLDRGGTVIATGPAGSRYGPEKYLLPRPANALDTLAGHARFRRLTSTPARDYRKSEYAPKAARPLEELLRFDDFPSRLETDGAESVSINLNAGTDEFVGALTLDVNNHDLEVKTDTLKPTVPFKVTFRLPRAFRGRPLRARAYSPGSAGARAITSTQDDEQTQLSLTVPAFSDFLLVVIQ